MKNIPPPHLALLPGGLYELIEWWTALASGAAADDLLGSQGDVWETQSDMFLALIGAASPLVLFSAVHSRALRNLDTPGR